MKKRIWRLLLIGFSVLALFSAALIIERNLSDNPSIPCLEGFSIDMSPGEVSEFLDIPLVTLAELPEEVLREPEVTADVEYPIESPVCGLKLTYLNNQDMRPHIIIEVLDSTNAETFDWSCLNYELRTSIAATDLRSACSKTLASEVSNLFVRVSSRYFSEETRAIVNNIVVNNMP